MSELNLVLNTNPSAPIEDSDTDDMRLSDDEDMVVVYHNKIAPNQNTTDNNNNDNSSPSAPDISKDPDTVIIPGLNHSNPPQNINQQPIKQSHSQPQSSPKQLSIENNSILINNEKKLDIEDNESSLINNNNNNNKNNNDKIKDKLSESYFNMDLQFPQTVSYQSSGICIYRQKSNGKGIEFMMGIEKRTDVLSFFGGKRDDIDVDAIHTCLREFDEETGEILDETVLDQMKQMLIKQKDRQVYWKDEWKSVLYFYNMSYDYDLVKNFKKKKTKKCEMKSLHWIDYNDVYRCALVNGESIKIDNNNSKQLRGFVVGLFLDKKTRQYLNMLNINNGGQNNLILNKYSQLRPTCKVGKNIPLGIRLDCINPIDKSTMFHRWINENVKDIENMDLLQMLVSSVFPELSNNFMIYNCKGKQFKIKKKWLLNNDNMFNIFKKSLKKNDYIAKLAILPTVLTNDFKLSFHYGSNEGEIDDSDNDIKDCDNEGGYINNLWNKVNNWNIFGGNNNNNNNNNNGNKRKSYDVMKHFKWQYQNDKGGFSDFLEFTSKKIEKAFLKGDKNVHYNHKGEFYNTNFVTMTQNNQKTSKKRMLRRVPLYTLSEYDEKILQAPPIQQKQQIFDYHKWQWYDNNNTWKDYDSDISKNLNRMKSNKFGPQTTCIQINNTYYTIDVSNYTQKNSKTGNIRKIRQTSVYKYINTSFKWQWKDDGYNNWKDYSLNISNEIESNYNGWGYSTQFKICTNDNTNYFIDLIRMKQKNVTTKKVRDIRRIHINDKELYKLYDSKVKHQWKWLNDSNNWVNYDKSTNFYIENAFNNKWNRYQFKSGNDNNNYEIIFSEMSQYNISTNKKRTIKRVSLSKHENWLGPKRRKNIFDKKCLTLYIDVGESIAKELSQYKNKFIRGTLGSFGIGFYFNENELDCKNSSKNKSNDNKGYLVKCKVLVGKSLEIKDINQGSFNFNILQSKKYDSLYYKSLINGFQYIVYSYDQICVMDIKKY